MVSTIGSVSIPVQGGAPISFDTAILAIDVQFMVGLHVFKAFSLVLHYQRGISKAHHLGWIISTLYAGGHAYIH